MLNGPRLVQSLHVLLSTSESDSDLRLVCITSPPKMSVQQLVFVPSIGLSHIIPTVEFAKRLLHHFSITFLIIPGSNRSAIESITTSAPPSIRFLFLPPAHLPPPTTEPGIPFISLYIQNHHSSIKQQLARLISDAPTPNSVRLFFDMFSSTVAHLARELSIPSYLYFTSSASFLGLMLHLPTLESESIHHSAELTLPTYANPVPTLSLPSALLDRNKDSYRWFLKHSENFARCNGIVFNSVSDLEICAFTHMRRQGGVDKGNGSGSGTTPPVYYPGPILNLDGNTNTSFGSTKTQTQRIADWLDRQPDASVVFICFGTRGSLSASQLKEMANGLERSGQRFLWSVRSPPTIRSNYSNPEEVLPSGFMDRVGERGMVCGWAPQVAILDHKAVGAFVTHCGWNSILESVWFGVPMLTWPLDAEQKLNAFEVVVDLEIAIELKKEGVEVVTTEDVEMGVRDIIEGQNEVRTNMKQISDKCRKAVVEGGSSFDDLECLIEDLKGSSCC